MTKGCILLLAGHGNRKQRLIIRSYLLDSNMQQFVHIYHRVNVEAFAKLLTFAEKIGFYWIIKSLAERFKKVVVHSILYVVMNKILFVCHGRI